MVYKKLIIFLIFVLFSSSVFSDVNKKIKIDGNEYIDDEVIFSIIGEDINNVNDENINLIIKKLFDTGNFEKIEVKSTDAEIVIKIIENPVINEINFEGNKRFKKEIIFEQFNKKEYFINYNTNKIDLFVDELTKLYKSFGYNLVKITYELSKIENENKFVNLNFNIVEGSISKINNIIFIGNESFSKRSLLGQIKSKPKNIFRILGNVNFKKFQIDNDLIKIKNFYKDNGFRDVNVEYETEFIASKNRFNVYFYINEGLAYEFNNINVETSNIDINSEQKVAINNLLEKFLDKKINKDNSYNNSYLDDIEELFSDYLFTEGLVFFDIIVLEKILDSKVDILFNIKNINPRYVNEINIAGNTRTFEKVIRREMTFAEGDAINSNLIARSNRNLRNLGIFKKSSVKEINISDDTVDVEVDIEEQSTGQFQIGVSFGTLEGANFVSGLSENNFGGVGRKVDLTVNTASKNTKYNLGVVEPYIFNKKMNLLYGLSFTDQNFGSSRSYNLQTLNTNTGISYDLLDDLSHTFAVEYNLKDYKVTDSSSVAESISKQSGSNADILLNNKFVYNQLNSFIRPTKGDFFSFTNIFSPITNSDNGYIKNTITHRKYYSFKTNVFSIQTRLGSIASLQNDEILTDDKFSLGGRWLRGFDSFGAGPRNSRTSYIGGNNLIVSKLDLQRPIFQNSDNPVDLNLFFDAGTVFDNKTEPDDSKESIRSSYGVGIKFYSPIGPVGFSWAFPITKESYDIERMFLFSIGNLN